MTICHWEVSSASTHFRKNDFTVMSSKKKQRSSGADDTDLNAERRESEWLRDTVIVTWDLLQIKISTILQKSKTTSNQSLHNNTESMMCRQDLKKETENSIMNQL